MWLTRAAAVAVGDLRKSPVAGLATITTNSADPGLARALTGHRVTCHAQRTNHVALTETCTRSQPIAVRSVHLYFSLYSNCFVCLFANKRTH